MRQRLPVGVVLAVSATLIGCATSSRGLTGAATAVMAPDGSIELRVRKTGLFGRGEVVVFKPTDPGYESVNNGFDAAPPGSRRKPVLTWTVGEPTYLP